MLLTFIKLSPAINQNFYLLLFFFSSAEYTAEVENMWVLAPVQMNNIKFSIIHLISQDAEHNKPSLNFPLHKQAPKKQSRF